MGWFKFNKRPKLEQMDTGNFALERPHSVPLTSVFGNGGIPVDMQFAKLVPGLIMPQSTTLPVSVGGASDQVFTGVFLETLGSNGEGMI